MPDGSENNDVAKELPFSHFGSVYEKYVLAALIAGIVVLGSYQLYQFYKPFDDEIVERDHDGPGFVININKDHAVFLSQLKRIDGPLGLRITEWRNEHGPFRTVDDLTQVEGIDQSIVDANRKWMSVE